MCSQFLSATNELRSVLEEYDEARGLALFEELADGFGVDVVAAEVVPLLLRIVAKRMGREKVSVRQQEFIRSALLAFLLRFARGWAHGEGPRAILASLHGAQQEVGLLGFGLALRRRGWRISYLGVEVPIAILVGSVRMLRPRLVALGVPRHLASRSVAPALRHLAGVAPLALLGATSGLADALGARLLGKDLIAEARRTAFADMPVPSPLA